MEVAPCLVLTDLYFKPGLQKNLANCEALFNKTVEGEGIEPSLHPRQIIKSGIYVALIALYK